MRAFAMSVLCAVFIVLVGCDAPITGDDNARTDKWLVGSYGDDAIKNAIVAQHTIYAYHFIRNSAVLNELGEHDVAVLARHYKKHPGLVNVRSSDTEAELYQDRVKSVVEALGKAGVDTARITVADGLPGGDGMTSERVVNILRASEASQSIGTYTTSGE